MKLKILKVPRRKRAGKKPSPVIQKIVEFYNSSEMGIEIELEGENIIKLYNALRRIYGKQVKRKLNWIWINK